MQARGYLNKHQQVRVLNPTARQSTVTHNYGSTSYQPGEAS